MTYETSTIGRAREILRITACAFALLEDDPCTIGYEAVILLTEAIHGMDDVIRYARSEWVETAKSIDHVIVMMSDTLRLIQSGHRNSLRVDRSQVLQSVMALGCTAQTAGHICRMHLPSISSRLIVLQEKTERCGNEEVAASLSVLLDPTDVSSGLVGSGVASGGR